MHLLFTVRKLPALMGVGLLALVFLLSSCGDTRHLTYMQGQFDTAALSKVEPSDPIIQKGDLLNIIVFSDNQAATALYNQAMSSVGTVVAPAGGGTGSTAGAQSSLSPTSSPSYFVDEQGNIQFQGLGILHVEGLTKSQLKDMLDGKLKDYLKNPYYTIRFLNYKFTILGEVGKPGIYTIPGERISILEAVGLAGDLTFYGRRDNILVIHENNGKREFARLDLLKPEIMASPYFYLQQNDIVIVEATKKRVAASDQVTARNVSIAAAVVSTLAIVYSIFK
jgi:polysaccharide export outer membrane protein